MKQIARRILLIVFLTFPFRLILAPAQPNQNEADLPKDRKQSARSLNLTTHCAPSKATGRRLHSLSYNATTGSNLLLKQAE